MPGGAPRIDGCDELERIGAGGFSTVYRGRQRQFDRTVAIKIIDVDLHSDTDRDRFAEECLIAGRVSRHPNIVTVLDAGVSPEGRPYIVSEFMPGGSLADHLERDGPRPPEEVLATGIKLSGALGAIHAAGISHADIKPDNVLVSEFGEPAFWDFGVSARADAAPGTTGEVAITFNHAAPERYHGAPPSPAADVYALCSTLYTLATGSPPFATKCGRPARGGRRPRAARRRADPAGRGDVAELLAILRVGLSKAGDDRYPTAIALGEALQAAEDALGFGPTPMVTTGDHTASTATRSLRSATTAADAPKGRRLELAVALAALLLLLLGVLWARGSGSDRTDTAAADTRTAASPAGGAGGNAGADGRDGIDGANAATPGDGGQPGGAPADGSDGSGAGGSSGAGGAGSRTGDTSTATAGEGRASANGTGGASTTSSPNVAGGAGGPGGAGGSGGASGATTTTAAKGPGATPTTKATTPTTTATTIRTTTTRQTTTTLGSPASLTATPTNNSLAHIPLHGTLYIQITNVGAQAGTYSINAPAGTSGGATGTGTVPGYTSRTITITDNSLLPRTFTVDGSFTGTAAYHLTVLVAL